MALKFNLKKKRGNEEPKRKSKFKEVMHLIFVHNIGYKFLALGTSLLCWFLTICLS